MPKRVAISILLLAVIFYASFKPVNASISSCTINSVSPQSLTSGDSATIVFNATNNDESSNLLHWLKISAPSNFVITSLDGPNSGGASINESGSEAIIMTTLSSGESGDFSLGVTTTGGVTATGSFSIQASDSSEGDSPVSCSGDTSVSLTSGGSSAISISNISLSVTDTRATLTWSSSLPTTGNVQYGTTSSYGNSVSDTTLGISHSVTIPSLSSSTTYHYLLSSTDQSSNTASLTDKTFNTSPSGETTTVTTTVTSTVTNTVREVYKDVILPSIKIKTDLGKIYESAPLIEFVVSDESGISRIRYSTDSGINWQNLDIEDMIGKKQITSNLTPNLVDDGEYMFILEVTDSAGNKSFSKPSKITIDRLPPSVGPLTIMAGPQIVSSGNGDIMDLLVDVEYKFILSAAGGPNSIKLTCGDITYDFEKNIDSGVWTSKIKFDETLNECVPFVKAVDGAGNTEEKTFGKIRINKRGLFKNGVITVYWYDDFERKFVVWDASPYGQINPISTSATGGYALLLPAGKYYIEAKSAGKRTTVSNIIDLSQTAIVNDNWSLNPVWKFWQLTEQKIISPKILGSSSWQNETIDLPKINLNSIKSGVLSTLELRGKNTVVGLTSSWHPLSNSYLKTLDELNSSGVSSFPVLMHEKVSTANFLKRRGGYDLNIYADPDGEFLNDLDIKGLPATLIVNKFGKIEAIKYGDITKQEVLDVISKTF